MTWPSLPTRNLVKFHLMASPGIRPDFSLRSHSKSGWASSPLTSTLANIGKVTPKVRSQNDAISVSSPGSCPPNWLQGKPRTLKPCSA